MAGKILIGGTVSSGVPLTGSGKRRGPATPPQRSKGTHYTTIHSTPNTVTIKRRPGENDQYVDGYPRVVVYEITRNDEGAERREMALIIPACYVGFPLVIHDIVPGKTYEAILGNVGEGSETIARFTG